MSNYDDIINMPRPEPQKHQRMSLYNRAAQFSPFSALTGYEASIKEEGRLTNERIEIGETAKEEINYKLQILMDEISSHPEVTITYFEYDQLKEGGKYVTVTDRVKKIDVVSRGIFLSSGKIIPIEEIIELESDIFPTFI